MMRLMLIMSNINSLVFVHLLATILLKVQFNQYLHCLLFSSILVTLQVIIYRTCLREGLQSTEVLPWNMSMPGFYIENWELIKGTVRNETIKYASFKKRINQENEK